MLDRISDLAVRIQQIAAPTFHELARSRFVLEQFTAEGLVDLHLDEIGNVYGRMPGASRNPAVVVSAHLDTVFPPTTDLAYTRTHAKIAGPGIGDNSLGVAGLFGLIWLLRQQQNTLPGDLWLVANVAEEGLGDLRGMKAVVQRFGSQPKAYVILEGMALGVVYYQGLGVRRYRIIVRTQGGHSWVNFGRPSAVHELARLVTRLETLPVPAQPRSSYNVGVIQGGTSVNTIAASASLELDLRSQDPQTLDHMAAHVEQLVRDANRLGEQPIEVQQELIGNRPAGGLSADHPLVRLAEQMYADQGVLTRIDIGSTDANAPLSQGYPAVCVGLTTGSGAHTLGEYIDLAPLRQGMVAVTRLVEAIYTAY